MIIIVSARNIIWLSARVNSRTTDFNIFWAELFLIVKDVDTASYAYDTTPSIAEDNIEVNIEDNIEDNIAPLEEASN